MKQPKIRLTLNPTETNLLLLSLNQLRNLWLEKDSDTFLVDELFLKIVKKAGRRLPL